MTTNLWTVGQGLDHARLVPKTKPGAVAAAAAGPKRSSRTPPKDENWRRQQAEAAAGTAADATRQEEEGRRAPLSDVVSVEATGETVGEAKWKALRDLERAAPGLDKASVRFQVVSEGERGLLGVGYTPARVVATVSVADIAEAPSTARDDESELETRMRELVETVVGAMGIVARVDVHETDDEVLVTCTGGDLGLLIGKHGQTIDALQYVANAASFRSGAGKPVTIDAAGYRERRRVTLEGIALRAAEQAAARRARAARADDSRRAEGRARAAEGRRRAWRPRARGRSPIATSSSRLLDDAWLAAVVATPGLTAIRDLDEARRMLLDDSLRGAELVARFDGPIVDVGSGGGASRHPARARAAGPRGGAARGRAAQVRVPRAVGAAERARRLGPCRGAGDRLGGRRRREGARAAADRGRVVPAARARGRRGRALGGAVGRRERVAGGGGRIAGELEESPDGFLVIRKLGPTPPGFPRRTGVAKKRPLASCPGSDLKVSTWILRRPRPG